MMGLTCWTTRAVRGGVDAMASELGVPVCINVYDLHEYNRYVHFIGFGAYHTA